MPPGKRGSKKKAAEEEDLIDESLDPLTKIRTYALATQPVVRRARLCRDFAGLVKAFGVSGRLLSDFFPEAQALLTDPHPEVRKLLALQLGGVATLLADVLEKASPAVLDSFRTSGMFLQPTVSSSPPPSPSLSSSSSDTLSSSSSQSSTSSALTSTPSTLTSSTPSSSTLTSSSTPRLKVMLDWNEDSAVVLAFRIAMEVLLPWLRTLMSEQMVTIRLAAAASFVQTAHSILAKHPALLQETFQTTVDELASSRGEEHKRELAVVLVRDLWTAVDRAALFPKYFGLVFETLAGDAYGVVREAVASSLYVCARSLAKSDADDQPYIGKLWSAFAALAQDSLWKVKRECVLALPEVGALLDEQLLCGPFADVVRGLIQDESRWIRQSIAENLAPTLVLYAGCADGVPAFLVDFFVGLASKAAAVVGIGDQDGTLLAAYCFPAVLRTLGPAMWEQKLKVAYLNLTKDFQHKVRRTLAFSLHEVAAIVGEQIAEADLLPVFDRFLYDMAEVKIGVVQNIGAFLSVLSQKQRKKYIALLQELYGEQDDWRSRLSIIKQVSSLASILSPPVVLDMILSSCKDRVADIRNAAAAQIGSAYKSIGAQHPTKAEELIRGLLALGRGTMQNRQTFARACASMLHEIDRDVFAAQLFPQLLQLSTDPVANVRACAAQVLADPTLVSPPFADVHVQVRTALGALGEDRDPQVRRRAQSLIDSN